MWEGEWSEGKPSMTLFIYIYIDNFFLFFGKILDNFYQFLSLKDYGFILSIIFNQQQFYFTKLKQRQNNFFI